MAIHKVSNIADNQSPLGLIEIPVPEPGSGEIRIRVLVCGVCHTELDEIEGRTAPESLPMIPGHQVVGIVDAIGSGVTAHHCGDRVGVGWIASACGVCERCREHQENLCEAFRATGRDRHGGYAEYMLAREHFAVAIPESISDLDAAPLLCAGAIGFRSWHLTGARCSGTIGLMGFGASNHLVLKLIRNRTPDVHVFVFARNESERDFARSLGAHWTGDITDTPPAMLDAAIDTTPVWTPVLKALQFLRPGGRVVVNAIRKETADIRILSSLDYEKQVWMEKEIKSVANVTREDIRQFLSIASDLDVRPDVQEYDLLDANRALIELKKRIIRGAKVLRVSGE